MYSTTMLIAHMKQKGIKFNIASEDDARLMLEQKNYYFKLTSYRKNFPKIDDQYQNLDFAYLTDLASIDMQLREYLLNLSLDIEHGIKVKLMSLISNDPSEDGYSIVQDFKAANEQSYQKTISYLKKNRYLHDLYEKHHAEPSIWVFFEVMTLGTLSMFVDFYVKRSPVKAVKRIHKFLKFTKNIRNACAHNNPLLVNLFSEREFLRQPSAPVKSASNTIGISSQYLNDLKVNDLVSLFYLHQTLQSPALGKHRVHQGKRLINRFHRHSDWYADNVNITTFIKILTVLVDYIDCN
ncbi:Abi family protein [Lactobacillus sp. LC28-10]|uniref:Abi family protein n=2 Tax=Secundilactobacillus angelensis TaxID=2722706 RepID=A0ABX1KW37_9LACO|nr:Abi family protein [Secundilactobacillus angelensis]